MKVSIITICYNRVQTICEAIVSVLEQDYPNIEFIIVDGASSDGTTQKIREAIVGQEEKVKLISEPDNGLYDALNKGIRMATGDVIGMCHSDDVLFERNTISQIVDMFNQTDCDLLYADGLYVDASNAHKVVRKWIGGRYSKWKVRQGWLPLHTTCYIKRQFMLEHGLYDERYKIAADTDLLLRYLLLPDIKVVYLHEYVTRMRMGGVSTDVAQRKKMWHEDIMVYSKNSFALPVVKKIEKVIWKIPQFIKAKIAYVGRKE